MPVYFWIAIGTAFAALLVGLILKARVSHEQNWEELVDGNRRRKVRVLHAPHKMESASSTDSFPDSRQSPKVNGEEMKKDGAVPDSGPHAGIELRRSSRVQRAVPLIILGTNRRGETFQERTSAVTVNLHGCRYSSRNECAPEGWVTLQVTGTEGAGTRPVRARIRSVLSPQTPVELCQVGVELETPGNVWGIPAPPEDWQQLLNTGTPSARAGAADAPVLDPSTPPPAYLERTPFHAERRAEVTVFPGASAPAPAPTEPPALNPAPASESERVVLTAEQLLQALQGRIDQVADKAVQASLSAQLDDVIKGALGKIEEGWKANVRQTEEFSAARLAEAQNLWEKELVVYRSRADETARRLEGFTSSSNQSLAEVQKFVERFTNEIAPQFHARITQVFSNAIADFENRAGQISQHRLAELTQSAQAATRDSSSQLDQKMAEIRSLSSSPSFVSPQDVQSLVHSAKEETLSRVEESLKGLSAVSEQQGELARQRNAELARQLEGLSLEIHQDRLRHEQDIAEVRSLLSNADMLAPPGPLDSAAGAILKEQAINHFEARLGELHSNFEQQQSLARERADELSRQLEGLASETRQARTQHEQGLAVLRGLLANVHAGVPQEQIDAQLHSAREGILSHLEWRIGEICGHFDQLLGQTRGRSDELAKQLEDLSAQTRDIVSEIRNIAERTSHQIQPVNPSGLQESVDHAREEFENAAARVSDRQLIRLMELKQSVSQEVSLEFDARASEARALLQKAANTTLDDFRYRVETQVDLILADARQRLSSSLAALEADSRAAVEARHRTLQADVARAAEQSALEFRSGIKAFLYSCLVAAVSAVDQHAQTTLAGISSDPASLGRALDASAVSSPDAETPPPPAKAATNAE